MYGRLDFFRAAAQCPREWKEAKNFAALDKFYPNSPKTYIIVPINSVVDSEILGYTLASR
jgi:hypothetical protein